VLPPHRARRDDRDRRVVHSERPARHGRDAGIVVVVAGGGRRGSGAQCADVRGRDPARRDVYELGRTRHERDVARERGRQPHARAGRDSDLAQRGARRAAAAHRVLVRRETAADDARLVVLQRVLRGSAEQQRAGAAHSRAHLDAEGILPRATSASGFIRARVR
jgi:hypothetical protein